MFQASYVKPPSQRPNMARKKLGKRMSEILQLSDVTFWMERTK
jgi:hypothetical protein